ncbi:uncharacterized protein LOC108672276 [Hyalella azteca]|uniref:Uncharacterized protein LOC108672276 n=1 Tax=Hyalella azteca TaxID=294128 RepID=A0A8B7NNW9_HYAAZ|nr:uncharacterized protein LOC108672276 [Hyalella azteca]
MRSVALTCVPYFIVALVVLSHLTVCNATKIECYVDKNGDKTDPNNIYRCAADHTCCQEEGLPSCCMKKASSVAMWEQIQLWGILGAGIIVLGLVMWFCRHDGDCCCNAKDGRKSCCGKPYGKKPDDKFAEGYGVPSDTESDDDDDDSDDDDEEDDKNKDKSLKKKPYAHPSTEEEPQSQTPGNFLKTTP